MKTSNKTKPTDKGAVVKKTTVTQTKAVAAKAVNPNKLTAKAASSKAVSAKKSSAKAVPTKAIGAKAVTVKAQLPKAAIAKVPTAKAMTAKASGEPAVKGSTPKTVVSAKAATTQNAAVKLTASQAAGQTSPSRSSAAPKVATAVPPAQTPKAKTMSVTKVEPVTSPVEPHPISAVPAPAPPEQFVRATRPSARLTQITVPSLPPAVASTAAKSSFLPSAAPAPVYMPFAPLKKDPKLANNWKTKKAEELTDAEILAMSDDHYMNDKQMACFRLKLSRLKQDILANAGQTTENLREDTVVVPDPADRATIEEEHALELRTRDRERKLLKKIEQSIQRIDAGDYGFCDETGEAIGVGRLLARPTATLSLEAQQRRELKQKMFGD